MAASLEGEPTGQGTAFEDDIPEDGISLADRVAAAETAEEAAQGDSLRAVRNEAMEALQQARAEREEEFARTHAGDDLAETGGGDHPADAEVAEQGTPEGLGWSDAANSDQQADAPGSLDTATEQEDVPAPATGEDGASNGYVFDYSPAVAPPTDDPVDEEPDPDRAVSESRYRRNSARLPRIGIEPGKNADTIANLRKKMRDA